NQSHQKRELIVSLSAQQKSFAYELARLGDLRIRVYLAQEENLSPALARSRAMRQARGRFVCLWNEDVLDDAARLEAQMSALAASGAASCILRRVLNWMPGRGQLTVSRERLWD